MKRKKLVIAVTNRSSYNKVKTIVYNLPDFIEPMFMLGNSIYLYHYGSVINNISRDFPAIPKLSMNFGVEGDNLAKMSKTVGLGCIEASTLLDNHKPDMVITVADRFETLATAVSSSYMNIPLVHLQGGEQTGTIDDKVRNAITQLADYHFAATFKSGQRVAQMKEGDREKIFNYGCPSMDLLIWNTQAHDLYQAKKSRVSVTSSASSSSLVEQVDNILKARGGGDRINVSQPFVIVMLHPDTTCPISNHVLEVVNALNEIDEQKIIFWPNIDSGTEMVSKAWRMTQSGFWKSPTRFIRHLDPEDFGALLLLSKCIVGNSSTGIRESSFLGTPSVNIGHRQNNRETAENVVSVPFNKAEIKSAINYQIYMDYKPSILYGDGCAGQRIAERIGDILGK